MYAETQNYFRVHAAWSMNFFLLHRTFCYKLYIILQDHYTLAVMHVGAPSCGMNAAVRSFVRNCIYRGDKVRQKKALIFFLQWLLKRIRKIPANFDFKPKVFEQSSIEIKSSITSPGTHCYAFEDFDARISFRFTEFATESRA